jgi:hypothetical protein
MEYKEIGRNGCSILFPYKPRHQYLELVFHLNHESQHHSSPKKYKMKSAISQRAFLDSYKNNKHWNLGHIFTFSDSVFNNFELLAPLQQYLKTSQLK